VDVQVEVRAIADGELEEDDRAQLAWLGCDGEDARGHRKHLLCSTRPDSFTEIIFILSSGGGDFLAYRVDLLTDLAGRRQST
jgi:hypothetical protein